MRYVQHQKTTKVSRGTRGNICMTRHLRDPECCKLPNELTGLVRREERKNVHLGDSRQQIRAVGPPLAAGATNGAIANEIWNKE